VNQTWTDSAIRKNAREFWKSATPAQALVADLARANWTLDSLCRQVEMGIAVLDPPARSHEKTVSPPNSGKCPRRKFPPSTELTGTNYTMIAAGLSTLR